MLVISVVGYLAYSMFVVPGIERERYKAKWVEKFRGFSEQTGVPAAWTNDVSMWRLNDQEWILAAMYHGTCCTSNPRFQWEASVFLDNRGMIATANWAPCGGGIEDQVLADSLDELYRELPQYAQLTTVETNHNVEPRRPAEPSSAGASEGR